MELFRTNNIYMFIGRNRAWSNEASPDTPTNLTALSNELDVWNDIIVLKKVSISDVSLVVPRYDYSSSVAYTEYEHDKTDLFTRDGVSPNLNPFYVVKQEYSGMYTVWKCVANVKNTAPTSEPTWANGISATHFRDNLDVDGYLWKYMYRITNNDMTKFGTTIRKTVKIVHTFGKNRQIIHVLISVYKIKCGTTIPINARIAYIFSIKLKIIHALIDVQKAHIGTKATMLVLFVLITRWLLKMSAKIDARRSNLTTDTQTNALQSKVNSMK